MHHATFPFPAANFRRHVDEAFHLSVEITVRSIPSILAPLTAEDAALRRCFRHGWDGITYEWQSLRLIEPGPFATASGECLVQKWCVDDADDRLSAEDEGNRDAEHWEDVGVVHGALDLSACVVRCRLEPMMTSSS